MGVGRLSRWLLAGLLGALLVLSAVVAVWFILLRGRTPPIADASGRPIPGSIALLEQRQIGGAAQTLLIRGYSTANPVLLFLHGGPGMPAMFLAHAFQAPLERDFLVVHWDRRGAGKSYAAGAPAESLTVQRTLADLYEVTRYLRRRFQQERIYLVAHSWGTYLGLRAVAEHPEWYTAYIGMGQLSGDSAAVRAAQRDSVLARALALGDTALAGRVRRRGRATEDELFAVGGELHRAQSMWPLLRTGLRAPEYTLFDALNVPRGAARLWQALGAEDTFAWQQQHQRFQVPVCFFLGRHDFNTPAAVAALYLEEIQAPLKRLVWFEESAHFPFFEEPERFHAELLRLEQEVRAFWGSGARPAYYR